MRHRRRPWFVPGVSGNTYYWLVNWNWSGFLSSPDLNTYSFMWDDLGRDRVNPLWSRQISGGCPPEYIVANDGYSLYMGNVQCNPQLLDSDLSRADMTYDLQAYAITGQSRCRIIKPVFDLNVEIAELRDLPHLARNVASLLETLKGLGKQGFLAAVDLLFKQAGDTSLGYHFGVMPLQRSLQKVGDLMIRADRIVNTILRNEGRIVHRRADLLDTSSTSTTEHPGDVVPVSTLMSNITHNSVIRTRKVEDRIWYETGVSVQIPDFKRMSKEEFLLGQVLGQSPTPAQLWELQPFSWMVDWAVNVSSWLETMENATLYSWHNPCIMHETVVHDQLDGLLRYKTAAGIAECYPSGWCEHKIMRRFPHDSNRPGYLGLDLGDPFRQIITGSLLLSRS